MNFIVAVDETYGIGKDGKLLAYLPGDLPRLKEITKNKVVIMGRKTLESLPKGKPLSDRTNIILSRNKDLKIDGVTMVRSTTELLEEIKKYKEDDVFVLGGSSVYNHLIPLCKWGYITKIHNDHNGDVHINNIDKMKNWELIEESEPMIYKDGTFSFAKYLNRNME